MPGFFNKYPYTDFHELNLDYVLEQIKQLTGAMEVFTAGNKLNFADPILWDITAQYPKNTIVLEIIVNGRLDTVSAPELEKAIIPIPGDINELAYDFSGLEYISSAGLRTLLHAHRSMKMGGKTKITGCNQVVKEVFNVTGLADVMEIG